MSSFGHDERRGAFFSFRPRASAVRRRPLPTLGSPITVATHDVEATEHFQGEQARTAASPDSAETIPESLRIPILFPPTGERSNNGEGGLNGDHTRQQGRPSDGQEAELEGNSSRSLPPLLPRPLSSDPAPPSPSLLLPPPSPALCEEGAYDDDRTATSTCDESASTYRSPSPLSRHRRCDSAGRHSAITGRWADRGVSSAGMAGELSSALASCWRGITFRRCCHPLSPLGSGGVEDEEDDDDEEVNSEAAIMRQMAAAVRHKRKFDAFVPISEEELSGGGGSSDDGATEAQAREPAMRAAERLAAPSPPPQPREPLRPRRSSEHQPPQITLQFRPSEHGLCDDIGPLLPMFEGSGNGLHLARDDEGPYPEDLVLPSLMGS